MIGVFLTISIAISLCSSQFVIPNNGPCACDLTANSCDIGCCCDPSCSSFQNQAFTCANSQISPAAYGCLPTEVLFGNNTSFGISNDGNQVCVYRDNYALRNFYRPPNITAFVSYNPQTASAPVSGQVFNPSAVFGSGAYSVGSTVYTLETAAYVGVLAMPRAGANGLCVDGLPIQYLVAESISCQRPVTDCPNQGLNVYYKPNLLVANFPVAMISQFNSSIPLNSTGSFTTPIYTCTPSPCTANLVPAGSGSTCTNVVTNITITITGESGISGVTIALTVAPSVTTPYTLAAQVVFNRVGYNPYAAQFSGSPGYISGRPVVSYYPNSLTASWLIPAGGQCNSSSSLTPILFGFSGEYDCNLSWVAPTTLPAINDMIIATLNRTWPTFVAPFGNMATFSADWVPIVVENNNLSTPGSSPLLTKQSIYILYARNGTLTLPQNKIVGVKINNTYTGVGNITNPVWVTISLAFVDVSQPAYDINAAVIRRRSGRSVMDFLYMFYVENGARPSVPISQLRVLSTVVAMIVGYMLL